MVGEAKEAAQLAAAGRAVERMEAICDEVQQLLDGFGQSQPKRPRRAVWFVAGVVCVVVAAAVTTVLHPRGPLAGL